MKKILTLAAILAGLTFNAHAADLRICSGLAGGVYNTTATKMAMAIPSRYDIEVLESNGSMDNLNNLTSGGCEAALVQADAYTSFARQNSTRALTVDRVGVMGTEYVHMMCSKSSGIKDHADLVAKKATVAIGKPGSGAWVTWKNWEVEDDSYTEVTTVPVGGLAAVAKAADGSDVQCAMMVSGLPSASVLKYDARFGQDLTLVAMQDWDFNNATDPKGNKLYTFADIPSETYPNNLQTGFFGSAVGTVSVDAILVIHTDLYEREDVYTALLEAYSITR